MNMVQMLTTAAMSVLLVPSLAGTGAPVPTTNQMRGAGTVPEHAAAAHAPAGKPDAVWVEGHSRSGVFVPGHWQ